MQRSNTLLLIVCGAGAFFLPLIVRAIMNAPSFDQLTAAPGQQAVTNAVPQQPGLLPQSVGSNSTPIPRQAPTQAPATRPAGTVAARSPQAPVTANQPPGWPKQFTQLQTQSQMVHQASYGAAPSPAQPFDDIQGLLFKFAIATSIVLVGCVVFLQLAATFGKSRSGETNELEICDSIAISRESGVKLIRIGSERIVVGHDRQGLRSMVLLPARFDQVLAKEQEQGDPNGAIELAGDLRMAFANPEDRGWDLNRPKS